MSKRALRRLGALALGLFLPLLLLEVGIRAFQPAHAFLDRRRECFWILRLDEGLRESRMGKSRLEKDELLGWLPRPSISREGETTNSKGMRGSREFPREKPPGVRRIAVLGDSFTYGLDVADEETYCAQMEDVTSGIEVLNFGVNGFGTDQQYLYWKREASRYAPDVVLLGFFLPDVERNVLSVRDLPKPRFVLEGDELRLIEVPALPMREYVEGRVADCRSTSRVLDLLDYLRRREAPTESALEFQAKMRLGLAILERFQAEVRAQGAFFAVVVIPHPLLFDDPDQGRLTRAIEACGARAGFPVLDLTPRLREEARARPDRELYGDSEHWTGAGHALAAECILEFLRGQGVL